MGLRSGRSTTSRRSRASSTRGSTTSTSTRSVPTWSRLSTSTSASSYLRSTPSCGTLPDLAGAGRARPRNRSVPRRSAPRHVSARACWGIRHVEQDRHERSSMTPHESEKDEHRQPGPGSTAQGGPEKRRRSGRHGRKQPGGDGARAEGAPRGGEEGHALPDQPYPGQQADGAARRATKRSSPQALTARVAPGGHPRPSVGRTRQIPSPRRGSPAEVADTRQERGRWTSAPQAGRDRPRRDSARSQGPRLDRAGTGGARSGRRLGVAAARLCACHRGGAGPALVPEGDRAADDRRPHRRAGADARRAFGAEAARGQPPPPLPSR